MIYKFNCYSREWMKNYNKTYMLFSAEGNIYIMNRGTSVIINYRLV